jgi:hypothetical protein
VATQHYTSKLSHYTFTLFTNDILFPMLKIISIYFFCMIEFSHVYRMCMVVMNLEL